jgi:hypothetical protein
MPTAEYRDKGDANKEKDNKQLDTGHKSVADLHGLPGWTDKVPPFMLPFPVSDDKGDGYMYPAPFPVWMPSASSFPFSFAPYVMFRPSNETEPPVLQGKQAPVGAIRIPRSKHEAFDPNSYQKKVQETQGLKKVPKC